MKAKTCLFLISFLCLSTLANSQSWFPDGKSWVYSWSWWGNWGYNELEVQPGPVTINGMECKALSSHLHYVYYDFGTNIAHIIDEESTPITICQTGDSIFSLDHNGELILQYDFSMEPGDSILFPQNSEPVYKLVLESVGTETIGNQSLRTQQFTVHLLPGSGPGGPSYDGAGVKIIETIGMVGITGLLNNVSFLLPSEILHTGADYPFWSLRCTSGPDYEFKLQDDCYELILGTSNQNATNTDLEIYPNPVGNDLHILDKSGILAGKAIIYSINGVRQFSTDQLANPIPVEDLPAGIYLIIVETEGGVYRQKFLKG